MKKSHLFSLGTAILARSPFTAGGKGSSEARAATEHGGRLSRAREREREIVDRRSDEPRNPGANGMQSNPFVESDLALVNPSRWKKHGE